MDRRLGWAQETPDLFSATVTAAFGHRGHVVVEALPNGGWDWAAWAADGDGPCLAGKAPTVAEAKVAAEAAARMLSSSIMIDLGAHRPVLTGEARRPN